MDKINLQIREKGWEYDVEGLSRIVGSALVSQLPPPWQTYVFTIYRYIFLIVIRNIHCGKNK